jgi:hypothetical protein
VSVDHLVVVWTGGETAARLRGSGLGGYAPVEYVESPQAFGELLPPLRNPRLYLVDADHVDPVLDELQAAIRDRPSTWPPFVVFGEDRARLERLDFFPNSVIRVGRDTLLERLSAAASYWVRLNEPDL